MKDMDARIDERGMESLKSLIGMNLVAIGHDVISKLEPAGAHWRIFGMPFDAKVTRSVISLSKGLIRPMEAIVIKGSE